MNGVYVGYARVSRVEQHLERQLENLKKYALEHNITFENIYQEKVSGVSSKREELDKLLLFVREGDIVVVDSYSRISRSLRDLLGIIDFLKKKKVTLISLKENFNTSNAAGAMMLNFMAVMSEYERDLSNERQLEGVRVAKEKGLYRGRKAIKKPDNFEECLKKYSESTRFNKYKFKQFMIDTGLTKSTLVRFIKKNLP